MREQTTETERCRVKFALESHDLEEGMFKGMASVFNTRIESFVPTIIEPGAFTNTLAKPERNVLILWQHDDAMPIGVPVQMQETEHGLEIVGKISQTQQGKDAMTLMRDGVVTEMSIGFDATAFRFEENSAKDLMRHVTEVKLWEVSLVSFGANPKAKITEVQSRLMSDARELIAQENAANAPKLPINLAETSELWVLVGRIAEHVTRIKNSDEPLPDHCVAQLRDINHAITRIISHETSDPIDTSANQIALAEAELHEHCL